MNVMMTGILVRKEMIECCNKLCLWVKDQSFCHLPV